VLAYQGDHVLVQLEGSLQRGKQWAEKGQCAGEQPKQCAVEGKSHHFIFRATVTLAATSRIYPAWLSPFPLPPLPNLPQPHLVNPPVYAHPQLRVLKDDGLKLGVDAPVVKVGGALRASGWQID
jgi:hypothetical protein